MGSDCSPEELKRNDEKSNQEEIKQSDWKIFKPHCVLHYINVVTVNSQHPDTVIERSSRLIIL